MIEGSGSVLLTIGSRSRGPKIIRIRRIQIRNTDLCLLMVVPETTSKGSPINGLSLAVFNLLDRRPAKPNQWLFPLLFLFFPPGFGAWCLSVSCFCSELWGPLVGNSWVESLVDRRLCFTGRGGGREWVAWIRNSYSVHKTPPLSVVLSIDDSSFWVSSDISSAPEKN